MTSHSVAVVLHVLVAVLGGGQVEALAITLSGTRPGRGGSRRRA